MNLVIVPLVVLDKEKNPILYYSIDYQREHLPKISLYRN